MNVDPKTLLCMFEEGRRENVASLPNSAIVAALQDSRFEVRNVAMILATRRGMQVIATGDTQ